jgi:hypothetical protein
VRAPPHATTDVVRGLGRDIVVFVIDVAAAPVGHLPTARRRRGHTCVAGQVGLDRLLLGQRVRCQAVNCLLKEPQASGAPPPGLRRTGTGLAFSAQFSHHMESS